MTRFGRFTTTSAVVLGVGLSVLFRPAPRLIWNASASVPSGFYAVRPSGALHVDELLVVMPPEPLATFLDERHYLPKGVPLLKHALPFQARPSAGPTARSPSTASQWAKRSTAII